MSRTTPAQSLIGIAESKDPRQHGNGAERAGASHGLRSRRKIRRTCSAASSAPPEPQGKTICPKIPLPPVICMGPRQPQTLDGAKSEISEVNHG